MKLQVKVKLKMKMKVKVKYMLVKLSGSPRKNERKRVGAHHELSNRRSQLQVAARRTDAFDLQSGRIAIVLCVNSDCMGNAFGRRSRLMGKRELESRAYHIYT